MITCPNCAWRNPAGSRFCENCGADLETLNRNAAQPQPSWPQPPRQDQYASTRPDEDPTAPDWRMSPLPEEEIPKQKRRTWIWLLVVALLACLAFCVVSFGWLEYTDSGHNFQTRVAEEELNQTGD